MQILKIIFLANLTLLVLPLEAFAYIGPGAGFAFLGSASVFLLTLGMGILTLAFWPLHWAIRKARGFGVNRGARARRVVVVGLDGLDPKITEHLIKEGRMPNMLALKEAGSYRRLGTTLPALSPVAWSTFQTGVNPGAHNIFDFLTRDKRFCLPELSSTSTVTEEKRNWLGLKRTTSKAKLMRGSQPFWKILGKYGIFSNVIRIPISYPPEPFYGNVLSAMCTPDLKGTQGSFTYFTTKDLTGRSTGGEFQNFSGSAGIYKASIQGPADPTSKEAKPLTTEFELQVKDSTYAELHIGKKVFKLNLNEFSEWIEIDFVTRQGKVLTGICRFCLRELSPEISLYQSPLNVHPIKPVLPISQPIYFAQWLGRRLGIFGTLGLMEDTWGRNEKALDDRRFLDQAYLTHAEREGMFMECLERTNEGLCACVFDASDRIQHMFWRYLDDRHPSPRESDEFSGTIEKMYEEMDALVGRVRAKLSPKDLLIVLSDHGFASFRRGINLNTWLYKEGYLALKEGASNKDYLQDVDWEKTKAFALGLSGLYVNKKGREANGILSEVEAIKIKAEIVEKLSKLKDPENEEAPVQKVYDSQQEYSGIYAKEAPDLIVGYSPGYRVSWDSVTGMLEDEVFSDNIKAWSGDHHIDPSLVPGIFFSNWNTNKEDINIIDLAPTILSVFNVPVPRYMEGSIIL